MTVLRSLAALVSFMFVTNITGVLPSAYSSGAVLVARANVLPWATLNTKRHVEEYVIEERDIARGFVLVRSAATFQVATNSNRQIMIRPITTDGMTVLIAGPEGQGTPCLSIALDSGSTISSLEQTVDYRINLSHEVVAGRYPLHAALEIETY